MRTLYHGSTQPIEYPLAKIGRDNLDFGKGFYVTCLRRQAEQWAARMRLLHATDTAFISLYEFDDDAAVSDGFRSLCFESYNLNWLEFIVASRSGKRPWLGFDWIEGGVANDQVIDTVEDFISQRITAEQALACIGWYKARWLIEELFRVTKTKGFNVEEAALEDGEATKKLIVMTLCTALKTMALKNAYDRRDEEAEADLLFTPAETDLLHALAGMVHSWSPRAAGGNCPFRDGTMAWAHGSWPESGDGCPTTKTRTGRGASPSTRD